MMGRLERHRELVIQLMIREIRLRYHGSQLGMLWSLITPLLMLGVYTFVFSTVLQARWSRAGAESPVTYALTMFAGLIPFTLFSEVVNRSPSLVLSVPNYVKKVVFPLEVLPIVAIGSALFQSGLHVIVLMLAVAVLEGRISPTLPLVTLGYVPLVLLTLAVSWFLAALGVYLRDVNQVVGVVTQAVMFMSPIIYPVEAVPEGLRELLMINPLTVIIEVFRQTILWGEVPSWTPWFIDTGISLLLAMVGYKWFDIARRGFVDVM